MNDVLSGNPPPLGGGGGQLIVPYRIGIYINRQLILQGDGYNTDWEEIKRLDAAKAIKIVRCNYMGMLPKSLDDVSEPIFRKIGKEKRIIGYRKAVPR